MDLFNNDMVTNALKSMSPEDIANYKKIGEAMYGGINFVDNKVLNDLPPPVAESLAYVEVGLNSGLHPKDMSEDEIALMVNTYGDKWYEKYGYTKDEVPEVGLSLKMKEDIEKAVEYKLKEEKAKDDKRKMKKQKK